MEKNSQWAGVFTRAPHLAARCQVPRVCKEVEPDMLCVLGSHPSDPLIFPSLPGSLPAVFAWKLISRLPAFGRRALPSYGKVFNTNLMVCLAAAHPSPLAPPLSVPTGTEHGNLTLIPFPKRPRIFFPVHSRLF